MTTIDHRAEAVRLLSEAETAYRESRKPGKRGQQLAFGDFHADDALRAAGLLAELARGHAALAAVDVPTAARAAVAGGPVWLSARTGIPLGYYTGRQAAEQHCEDDARTVQGLDGELMWALDEDEPNTRAELDVATDAGTQSTGYTVTAITPATAYDPEEEL